MRRTRGDIGLRLFFAAAAWVVDFLVEDLLAAVLPFFAAVVEDFVGADFGFEGLVEAGGLCSFGSGRRLPEVAREQGGIKLHR